MANTKKPKVQPKSKVQPKELQAIADSLPQGSLPFKFLPLKMQVKKLHKKLEGLPHDRVDTLLEELRALVQFNREKALRSQRRNTQYLETVTHFR